MSNDSKWNETFNISDDKWIIMKNKALNLWDNLKDIKKNPNNHCENYYCPMHPNMFFHLSSVSGFNKINGYTYSEYVSNWRKRIISYIK